MGAKRNSLLAVITLGIFVTAGCFAANADTGGSEPDLRALPDAQLSEKVAESAYFSKTLALALDLRPTRLISADDFSAMSTVEDTIILDTRSTQSYAKSHLDGAISLPLTEMTELSLALSLPSRTVPILIYSDQNFGAIAGPITHDSSDLSLNLMSFLALNQYGYNNVFELGERLGLSDERFSWETADLSASALPISAAKPPTD